MSLIGYPTCNITLCNVPITPTQQIDFADSTAQYNFFQSHSIKTIEKCRYQPRTDKLKVKGYVDELQNANYGFYTNKYNGTSKTFFFWIVSKDYSAREVTHLTIQIDVFQTWLFDFNFTPCMVEREHVQDDSFGKHTIREDFELGDYVTITKKPVESLQGKPAFLVATTDTKDGSIGGIFGHTYSGFELKYFAYEDTALLTSYIKDLCDNGKGDAIAFIFTFPQKMLDAYSTGLSSSNVTLSGVEGICTTTETFDWDEQHGNFAWNGDSYIPHNTKMYCYPYNFITIKNASGGNVVLKLENFLKDVNGVHVSFNVDAVLTQHPTVTITPLNYSGKNFAIDDSISMQEFGLCSWNNDNYANWFAQHRNSISAQSANATSSLKAQQSVASNNYNNALDNRTTNAEKGAINTVLSTANALGSLNVLGATTNAIGGAANTYLDYQQSGRNANNDLANSNLMNTTNYQNIMRGILGSIQDAQVQPNSCKGDTSSCGLDLARDTATFFIEQTSIKPEYAQIIDFYFQMFGYQVNSVKIPSFKTRQKWNYIKTVNCSTYGNMPHEDSDAINEMFNNGITIWHDVSYMYNYDQENTIVGGV